MGKFFGAGIVLSFFIMLFLIAPMILLWSLNTLSEAGGANLYIPHELWTYVASYGLIFIFNVKSK